MEVIDPIYFDRFLNLLEDYLYEQGWYVNGRYIREKYFTYMAVEDYLEAHCYSRPKSKEIVENFRQQAKKDSMEETERKNIWDEGWSAFWSGKKQDACPDYSEQEKRDEWMSGWLTAQSSDESASPTEIS